MKFIKKMDLAFFKKVKGGTVKNSKFAILLSVGIFLLGIFPQANIVNSAVTCCDGCDLPGDFDDDSVLDGNDFINLAKYVYTAGTNPRLVPCEAQIDVNGSCAPTNADTIQLYKYLFKKTTTNTPICPSLSCCD